MNYKPLTFLVFLFFSLPVLKAQKPFVEGRIVYNVTITSADENGNTKEYKGSYNITIKGKQMRKELKMKNGYDDILIFNFENNTAYSLKTLGDKKYAIQLNMEDFVSKARKYEEFSLKKDEQEKKIAGFSAHKADINYRDGNTSVIFLTDEWQPDNKLTFERFPNCKFLPLVFDYTNENGSRLHFQAEHADAMPVENGDFRIPPDFKLISYNEYQQLSR
ncbi:MAG: hypothetical protein ACTHJ0_09990 [Flavipsychrobacter sp.]